jgi:starch synthase
VSGELFATTDKALDERTIGHNPERLCLLKGGIVYSNAVTTVSPNYAAETLHGGAAGRCLVVLSLRARTRVIVWECEVVQWLKLCGC